MTGFQDWWEGKGLAVLACWRTQVPVKWKWRSWAVYLHFTFPEFLCKFHLCDWCPQNSAQLTTKWLCSCGSLCEISRGFVCLVFFMLNPLIVPSLFYFWGQEKRRRWVCVGNGNSHQIHTGPADYPASLPVYSALLLHPEALMFLPSCFCEAPCSGWEARAGVI